MIFYPLTIFAHQPKLIKDSPSLENPHSVISPEISKGQFVWIREENHHKPLGVGRALLDSNEILEYKQGKAIKALHYIGDKIWEYGVKD